MRSLFLIIAISTLLLLISTKNLAQNFNRPTGIYALGEGTRRPMPRLNSIRNYPFVDGYAWRVAWTDFEIQPEVYDFSPILEAITELESKGLKLTMDMLAKNVPEDILNQDGAITFTVDDGDGGEEIRIAPWDSLALARWEKYCKALGDYLVPDAAMGGQLMELRNHSILMQVHCSVIGIGSFRDIKNELTNSPIYNRKLFTGGTVRAIHAMMDQFTDKFHFVGFWAMKDNNTSPTLADYLIDTLKSEFDGFKNPRLGFFQENLACSTPTTLFAWPLYDEQNNTFTMFQMLQSWIKPFMNPDKTNPCLTDSTGPDVGIEYAFNTYNCRYFEVYAADLDNDGFHNKLQEWHDFLQNIITSVEENKESIPNKFSLSQNYPNPFNPSTTIKYSIPNVETLRATSVNVTLKVYDMLGQEVATLVNKEQKAGNYEINFNANKLTSEIYFYTLQAGKYRATNKMLLLK